MKIEFDETNATVARAMGRALLEIAGEKPNTIEVTRTLQCGDMRETVTESQTFDGAPSYTEMNDGRSVGVDIDAATEAGTESHCYARVFRQTGEKPHDPEQVFETLSQDYLDNGAPYATATATVKASELGDSRARGADLAAVEQRAVGINFAPANPEKRTVGMVPELGAGYESWQNKAPATADVVYSDFSELEARAVGVNFAASPHEESLSMGAGGDGGPGSDCCPHIGIDDVFGEDTYATQPAALTEQAFSAARVDQHGVVFNPEYCGEAEEPFYTSGKQKGQWKKRRNVEQAAYDGWYQACLDALGPKSTPALAPAASALSTSTGAPMPPAEPAPLPVQNVAAAFGAPVAPAAKPLPANAGELMAWAAELQAAGRLTQPDITAAYAELGLALFDIFESATVPATLALERIGKLYASLSAKAGV